jgi:hypothetical protein
VIQNPITLEIDEFFYQNVIPGTVSGTPENLITPSLQENKPISRQASNLFMRA